MDNYNMGNLICVGNTIPREFETPKVAHLPSVAPIVLMPPGCAGEGQYGNISCIGYNNGMASEIFEATVVAGAKPEQPSASYVFVKGARPPQTPGPWPCTIAAGH